MPVMPLPVMPLPVKPRRVHSPRCLFKRALFSAPGLSLRHAVPTSPPLSLATNAAPSCIMFARSTGKTSTHTRHLDVLSIARHIMSVAQRSRQNWEILSRRHRRPLPPLLLLTKKQFHQMRPPKKICSTKCDDRTPPWGRGVRFVHP